MLRLGDMTVLERPPAKLLKALAVIADGLHQGFDLQPRIQPGKSKESCVLCALTVRDFLRKVGFERARVAPVFTGMWAWDGDKPLHSLGMGEPDDTQRREGHWPGHMVVVAAGYVIDTTLYGAVRPAWPQLTPMMAVPTGTSQHRWKGLRLIAGASLEDSDRPGYAFDVFWFDNPSNTSWHAGPDCERARRMPVVEAMAARFGVWEG
jgi:hypothetical protein